MTSIDQDEIGHVFVYGSLMRGKPLYFLEELMDLRLQVLPARVLGAILYDLGTFPGMVLEAKGGTVIGEVHRFRQLKTVLEILDEVEEYYGEGDPNNLYRRAQHEAELLNEEGLVSCWLYEYVGSLDEAELLESGIW